MDLSSLTSLLGSGGQQGASSDGYKNITRGLLVGGGTSLLGIFTIGFIFLQAIALTIIVYIMLQKKYNEQKKLTPDNKNIPTAGKTFLYAFLWGVGYFILGVIINIATGGIFAIAGIIILIVAGILYPILKSFKLAPKDLKDNAGEKVAASPFSYWTTAFIIAASIGIIISIVIAIVRNIVLTKVLKVAGPALSLAANAALPGSGIAVSALV